MSIRLLNSLVTNPPDGGTREFENQLIVPSLCTKPGKLRRSSLLSIKSHPETLPTSVNCGRRTLPRPGLIGMFSLKVGLAFDLIASAKINMQNSAHDVQDTISRKCLRCRELKAVFIM